MDKGFSRLKACIAGVRHGVPRLSVEVALAITLVAAALVLFPRTVMVVGKVVLVGVLWLLAVYEALLTLLGLRARRHGLPDIYSTWRDTALFTGIFFLLGTIVALS